MTPDKNFRMLRSTKTALALHKFKDAHDRGEFKRMMIDSQLREEAARREALKSKEREGVSTGKSRGAVAPE